MHLYLIGYDLTGEEKKEYPGLWALLCMRCPVHCLATITCE